MIFVCFYAAFICIWLYDLEVYLPSCVNHIMNHVVLKTHKQDLSSLIYSQCNMSFNVPKYYYIRHKNTLMSFD